VTEQKIVFTNHAGKISNTAVIDNTMANRKKDKSGNNDIHRKPKIEQDEQLLFMSMISKKIL
jgi:hypothetical protein